MPASPPPIKPPDTPCRPRGRRIVVVLAALGLLAAPAPGAGPPPLVRLELGEPAPSLEESVDPGLRLQEPRIRIGLGDERSEVSLSASGPFRVIDGFTGEPVWKRSFDETLRVVPLDPTATGPASFFSVQVASFADRAAADRLAADLAARLAQEARVVFHPDRRTWRVRVGRAARREDLADLSRRLASEGFDETWTPEEWPETETGGGLRLVDGLWRDHPVEASRIVVAPLGRSLLKIEGRSYRGLIEIRLGRRAGRLRVINEVPLEEYLRGVVPEELGPAVWPEFEALKAQAIAARTYTLGNLGQFADEGFDLCDSPRCQAYGGSGSEHRLSDQAVRQTRGEVLAWEGRPIRALYTSTCGGHTEDGLNVFENEDGPYLRGVPCLAERAVLEDSTILLEGRRPGAPGTAEAGDPEPLELGRLVVRGVAPDEALDGAWRSEPAGAAESRRWIRSLARSLGKQPARAVGEPPRTLGEIAGELYDTLGWRDRAEGDFGREDPSWSLRVTDLETPSPEERLRWAFLVERGIAVPFDDGSLRPGHLPSRGLVLGLLTRALRIYEEQEPERVSVRGKEGGKLKVVSGRTVTLVAPVERPLLFVRDGAGTRQVSRLELLPGDRLRLHRDGRGRADLLVAEPRKGPSDDRFSTRYRWEVSYSARELERTVNATVSVGRLRDLQVVARGRSGRVAELAVIGSRGRFTVRGFRIRRTLGLEETLFTMDLQRNGDGSLKRVTFTGRGWGHGVGLCQVGAYGMALRGRSYGQILGHYYTGASLVRAY